VVTHVSRGFSFILTALMSLVIQIIVTFVIPLTSPSLPRNKRAPRVWQPIRKQIDVAFENVTECVKGLQIAKGGKK
jgi:hypothetical protein